MSALLRSFNLTPANLLGRGGEAEVYALDTGRVLRIYKTGALERYVRERQAFYALVNKQRPPFELPLVLESGILDGRLFTIERRMRGRDFAQVLPNLTGEDRMLALASYLEVAAQIGTVRFPDLPFGELLTAGEPLRRESWPEFLWDRLQQTYQISRPDVREDVPEIDRILEHMAAELRELEGFQDKRLVHGDYFPANVFIDETHTVCGVGDFGYTSVVGDARMDVAGAIAYLEVVDGYHPDDTPFLMQIARERHGPEIARWISFYRLYYSFFFSVCKVVDPPTYAWCVRNFRGWLVSQGW